MPLLTVADVCERLKCSAATVYRLVHAGHLVAHKRPGRTGALRFSENDIRDYLTATRVRPAELLPAAPTGG